MHLPKFEYLAPKSIEEACSLLSKHKGDARIIAGGTDLLVKMKTRRSIPSYLISIKNIPDPRRVRVGARASVCRTTRPQEPRHARGPALAPPSAPCTR